MLTTITGVLASVAAICSAVYGAFKLLSYEMQTTPEQSKEDIDKKVSDEKDKVKQTGRPQE